MAGLLEEMLEGSGDARCQAQGGVELQQINVFQCGALKEEQRMTILHNEELNLFPKTFEFYNFKDQQNSSFKPGHLKKKNTGT